MPELVTVLKIQDVPEGTITAVDVRGTRISVANVDGAYYAFDDTCTHEECSLATGYLEGTTIACECHGAEFDLKTGKVLAPPAPSPIRVYKTHVSGSDIQIEL